MPKIQLLGPVCGISAAATVELLELVESLVLSVVFELVELSEVVLDESDELASLLTLAICVASLFASSEEFAVSEDVSVAVDVVLSSLVLSALMFLITYTAPTIAATNTAPTTI